MDILHNSNGSSSALVLFDMIEETIRSTFDTIVETAMKRRDNLLAQLFDSKKDFMKKEQIRVQHLGDLRSFINQINTFEITQSHAQSLQKEYSLRVQKEMNAFKQPTPLSITKFQNCGLRILEGQISSFGSIKQEPYINRGQPIDCFAETQRKKDKYNAVNGISLDSRQNIYIANLTAKRINVFSIQFEFIDTFGSGILNKPHSIVVQNNSVFVTDVGSHLVHKFSLPAYRLEASSDSWNANFPLGLTADCCNIYIADCNNNRVAVLLRDLTFQRDIGSSTLNHPRDVKLANDQLFVVDNSTDFNVHAFSRCDNTILKSFINLKDGLGHLFMSIDRLGNFIISDRLAKNIQVFSDTGQLVHVLSDGQYFGVAVTEDFKIICAMKSENTTTIAMY